MVLKLNLAVNHFLPEHIGNWHHLALLFVNGYAENWKAT